MSSNVPRIAYLGLPLGALALTHAGFPPHVIVLGQRDAPGTRRVYRRLGAHTPVLTQPDLGAPDVIDTLKRAQIDTIVSWFYPRRIPEAVLALAPRGAFGAHPSLLPRWRGPDPYFWAIWTGDTETGVSLHRLEPEYDTGAVVAQQRVAIHQTEHAWALARRLDRPGLALIVACAKRLAAGEALAGTPQNDALATLAPAPTETQLSIDWHRSAAEIVRLVRAAAPYPGARTELGDEVVDVVGATVYESPLPRALEPADAVWSPAGLVVRAADRGVLVTRIRTSDDATLQGTALKGLFAHGLAHVGFEANGARPNSGKDEA